MKTKLETIAIAVLLIILAVVCADGAENDWADIAKRSEPPTEEQVIQKATQAFRESQLLMATRAALPMLPPPSFAAAPALPENTRFVFWDIEPTNGTYFMLWGPSPNDLTNRIQTTGGTNSAHIVREDGVRNVWAVVAVDSEGIENEKLFNEHRLPLVYEQKHITHASDTPYGPWMPMFINALSATNTAGFFRGETISTIIP